MGSWSGHMCPEGASRCYVTLVTARRAGPVLVSARPTPPDCLSQRVFLTFLCWGPPHVALLLPAPPGFSLSVLPPASSTCGTGGALKGPRLLDGLGHPGPLVGTGPH